ncbi:MAG: hypothetical protein KBE04_04545 [Phycisphaerae bacterium]|nr:hypothetical protein [Phycisphaerae bacterium]
MTSLRQVWAAAILIPWAVGGQALGAGEADPPERPTSVAPEERRASPFGFVESEAARLSQAAPAAGDTSRVGPTGFVPLSVEAVSLQHLSAKTAAEVFGALTSPLGKIGVQEGSNTLFVFDTPDDVRRIVAEIRKADQAHEGVVMESVNLRFLEAKNLTPIVEKMVSPLGSVSANEASNTVVVCDTPERVKRILAEIRKADQTPPEIVVEVVLLDVRLGDDKEIGVSWDYLRQQPDDVGYRQNFTDAQDRLSMVKNVEEMFQQGIAYNTLGSAGELSVVTGTMRGVIHLIQDKRDAQIIASPRAMVVSGKKATIKAVEEVPYLVVTESAAGGQLQQTLFKDVGVTLEVTATVTDGNQVFLDAKTTLNVQSGSGIGGVPVVDTRESNTRLLLKDGQIVVMGGLRRQQKTKQVSQVPLLGDLPLVGPLFKSTRDGVTYAELVILLSPHVCQGEPVPAEVRAAVDRFKQERILDRCAGPAEALPSCAAPGR